MDQKEILQMQKKKKKKSFWNLFLRICVTLATDCSSSDTSGLIRVRLLGLRQSPETTPLSSNQVNNQIDRVLI